MRIKAKLPIFKGENISYAMKPRFVAKEKSFSFACMLVQLQF